VAHLARIYRESLSGGGSMAAAAAAPNMLAPQHGSVAASMWHQRISYQ